MKPRNHPIELNTAHIYLPPGASAEPSRGWRIFFMLLPVVVGVGLLLGLSWGHG